VVSLGGTVTALPLPVATTSSGSAIGIHTRRR